MSVADGGTPVPPPDAAFNFFLDEEEVRSVAEGRARLAQVPRHCWLVLVHLSLLFVFPALPPPPVPPRPARATAYPLLVMPSTSPTPCCCSCLRLGAWVLWCSLGSHVMPPAKVTNTWRCLEQFIWLPKEARLQLLRTHCGATAILCSLAWSASLAGYGCPLCRSLVVTAVRVFASRVVGVQLPPSFPPLPPLIAIIRTTAALDVGFQALERGIVHALWRGDCREMALSSLPCDAGGKCGAQTSWQGQSLRWLTLLPSTACVRGPCSGG
jgi:hypothetical protein